MKKTAILIDLGFVLHKLYSVLGNRHATAIELRDFAIRCIQPEEELFRIFCYHCLPYHGVEIHPLTHDRIDFSASAKFLAMSRFIRELAILDNIAFRCGELSSDGWLVKRRAVSEMLRTGRVLRAVDFAPDLKQKHVDMKIGLAVAWLSSKRIVDDLSSAAFC